MRGLLAAEIIVHNKFSMQIEIVGSRIDEILEKQTVEEIFNTLYILSQL